MIHFTNVIFIVLHHFGLFKLFLLLHCHLVLLNITFKTAFSFVLKRHAVELMVFANTSKPSTTTTQAAWPVENLRSAGLKSEITLSDRYRHLLAAGTEGSCQF